MNACVNDVKELDDFLTFSSIGESMSIYINMYKALHVHHILHNTTSLSRALHSFSSLLALWGPVNLLNKAPETSLSLNVEY